ncbi:MAG: electron transport complex subunit RsxC [Myxococcota bacterium]
MRLLGLKTFRHGVHPPEWKDDTKDLAIRQFPFAPLLTIPLSQHLGRPSRPVVREEQHVVRGQCIAEADGDMSVPMHAPATGRVRRIAPMPGIAGRMTPGVFLTPQRGSTQEVAEGEPCPLEASPEAILTAIQSAGIVGLGGAAFPTHVKLRVPEGRNADVLVINGVECEPFLTTDHRVMLEQREDVLLGIRYVLKATGAERAIVAIEANKPDAADHLRAGLPAELPIAVEVLPVKYPQGAEKMLIHALLGRRVPPGGLPIEVGALCVNVATCAEIGRLLPHGRGIQERVVTVTGPAVRHKGNYRVPIGTPLRFLLEQVGVEEDVSRVFLGGPMMGAAASSLDIALTKGTSGVVAFRAHEAEDTHRHVYPCIRCGYCVDACPMFLNPARLGLLARNEEFEQMAEEHHLMDCFECGCCSFVCPSHLPLVQSFRVAKAAVRKARAG